LGQRFLEPGLLFKAPIDQISLGMALVFGTAGLPHILMRFFTVPTAQAARKSVIWAMAIIGGFYVLTLFLGMGAAMKVGADQIRAIDPGGNMAAPLLAQALGGGADSLLGNFMLAFVAAVAFATIVAVVAGLVLAAASAMAHDLYVGVIREEHVTPAEQVKAARVATIIVGALAITIGIAAKGQNVAHLVALAFAVASSANFPCVLLTLYWKRCNTGGIVLGMIVGTFAAIGLVLVSPNMTYPLAVKAAQEGIVKAESARIAKATEDLAAASDPAAQDKLKAAIAKSEKAKGAAEAKIKEIGTDRTSIMGLEKPLFELRNPGLVSIPLGFLAVIVGSLLYRDRRAEDMWDELYARQNTGILVSKAAAH
jgi:cation/acetate symporter